MIDKGKRKKEFIYDLTKLHRRITELEKSESHCKQAEMENEKSTLYLQAVLSSAPDVIITMDAQHKIITCNQGAEKLFGYSKIGKIKPEISKVDVNKLLSNLVSKLNIRDNVKLTLPKNLPIIHCPEIRLEQIFSNLLSNALKFNKSDNPHIIVGYKETNNTWEFSVKDNGIGISPKYFDKIFGIFQQVHTQEEYEGTGIGLAIVKKAVEQHGGTIWVESTPNKGSVFSFTLQKNIT